MKYSIGDRISFRDRNGKVTSYSNSGKSVWIYLDCGFGLCVDEYMLKSEIIQDESEPSVKEILLKKAEQKRTYNLRMSVNSKQFSESIFHENQANFYQKVIDFINLESS